MKHLQTLEEVVKDKKDEQALVQSIMEDLEKQRIAYKAEIADQTVRYKLILINGQ